MKKNLLTGCLISICIGVSSLNASQKIVIDGNNLLVLNNVLKKLIEENRVLKKELDEVKQYCKETKEQLSILNEKNLVVKENIASFGKSEKHEKYMVTAWQLNLRDKPMHTDSRIMKTVSIGNTIEIVTNLKHHYEDSVWLKTKEGFYLNSKFIKKIEFINIQTVKKAAIRTKPIGGKESFLKEVPKGIELKAVGELKDWYVLNDGSFIYKDYVVKL